MNRLRPTLALLGLAAALTLLAGAASAQPAPDGKCPLNCYCSGGGWPLVCPTWDLASCNEDPDCMGGKLPEPWPGPDGCVNNPGSCVTVPGGGPLNPTPGNPRLHPAVCAVIDEANCWTDPKGCIKKKIVEETGVPADVVFPSPGYAAKYTCYTCCLLLSQTAQGGYSDFQLKCQDCCDGLPEAWCRITVEM